MKKLYTLLPILFFSFLGHSYSNFGGQESYYCSNSESPFSKTLTGALETSPGQLSTTSSCNALILASQVSHFTFAFGSIVSGSPVSYAWNFGDGNTSTAPAPVHTYQEIGIYLVTLTVTSATGCTFTAFHVLYAGPPCYNIIIALAQGNLTYAFGAIATGNVHSWHWDFGDGHTSSEPAPVHTFPSFGTYLVTLTTITEDNCTYTDTTILHLAPDCVCPEIYDPVCVITPEGKFIEFENACVACCYGYDQFVPCEDCVCPDIWDPVCVTTCGGALLTFGNACEAECAGYDVYEPCESDCICPEIYDPVCVLTADGTLLEFSNACEACCAGYGEFVACSDCFCPAVYDPVCVTTCSGVSLTFENACQAECAGYSAHEPCLEIIDFRNAISTINFTAHEMENTLDIFPNPATSQFTVRVKNFIAGNSINIYNSTGTCVGTYQLDHNEMRIEHGLPEGMYYVQYSNAVEGVHTRPILIQSAK